MTASTLCISERQAFCAPAGSTTASPAQQPAQSPVAVAALRALSPAATTTVATSDSLSPRSIERTSPADAMWMPSAMDKAELGIFPDFEGPAMVLKMRMTGEIEADDVDDEGPRYAPATWKAARAMDEVTKQAMQEKYMPDFDDISGSDMAQSAREYMDGFARLLAQPRRAPAQPVQMHRSLHKCY